MIKQGTLAFTSESATIRNKRQIIKSDKFWLFKQLLDGCYIAERISHDRKYSYCLYEGKSVPITFIKSKEVSRIRHLFRKIIK